MLPAEVISRHAWVLDATVLGLLDEQDIWTDLQRNIDEPDDYFDVARSERTLQWLPDPQAAVLEMARTTRPARSSSPGTRLRAKS